MYPKSVYYLPNQPKIPLDEELSGKSKKEEENG